MRLPLALNYFIFLSSNGRTAGFELADCGSNPRGKTVLSFLLVKMLDCESGNRVRIPATPTITFGRLTDKPNGYEPLITRSNRVRKTTSRYDGIGRHSGLRNHRRKAYRFDPCYRYLTIA